MLKISDRLLDTFIRYCSVNISKQTRVLFLKNKLDSYNQYVSRLKYIKFQEDIAQFNTEEEYLSYIEFVKTNAIRSISSTEDYRLFTTMDLDIGVSECCRDINTPLNDGRKFISISMRQSDFNTLNYFSQGIFSDALTWENFIGKFTNLYHLINSDTLRHEIFQGLSSECHESCDAYGKYIMSCFIPQIQEIRDITVESLDRKELVVSVNESDKALDAMIMMLRLLSTEVPVVIKLFVLQSQQKDLGYIRKTTRSINLGTDSMNVKQ